MRARFFSVLLTALVACSGRDEAAAPEAGQGGITTDAAAPDGAAAADAATGRDDPATLDVACWNIEWFGSPSAGPSDEDRQEAQVTEVLRRGDLDLWALEEIVDEPRFRRVVTKLPGYGALLASDADVGGGRGSYGITEQKVALIYRKSALALLDARVILTESDVDFAGRPPLEAHFTRLLPDGSRTPLTVIALHMKAGSDLASWTRRSNAAAALKTFLDGRAKTEQIFVLGDFNDDVNKSITSGKPSPYAVFADDPDRYVFPTRDVVKPKWGDYPAGSSIVEHHMVTAKAASTLVEGSAAAVPLGEWFGDISRTASDHLPMMSRYRM